MNEQSNSRVDKRKLQIFIVFLLCSFLIWLISKLSESYTERTSYALVYTHVPDSLMLVSASKNVISARVQTSGFQLLSSGFRSHQINIDVSKAKIRGGRYYISPASYRRQMEQQLSGSINLQELDTDTLFLDLYALVARKVPVRAELKLELAQNYMMKGGVEIDPDSILVRGPENDVGKISEVITDTLELLGLQENFSEEVRLNAPDTARSLSLEVTKVRIRGTVFRFSEKVVEIPVTVINLPENTEIKIFPNTISVLCRSELEMLKSLDKSQFVLEVDYKDTKGGAKYLPVTLSHQPETIQSAQPMVEQVEYLVIRK